MSSIWSQQYPLPFEGQEVSVNWTCGKLRCSTDTVYRLLESGQLRGYRFGEGGWWRISKNSVIEFIEGLQGQSVEDAAAGNQPRG